MASLDQCFSTLYYRVVPCSLGNMLVAATDRGVCAILLGESPEELVTELGGRFPTARIEAADSRMDSWVKEAADAAERPGEQRDLPLDLIGTEFQQKVWNALQKIPAGSTVTYTEIAKVVGAPKAYRAVARACASNNVAVLVPCHRVIRSDGSLSGYRWGVERKQRLLDLERH